MNGLILIRRVPPISPVFHCDGIIACVHNKGKRCVNCNLGYNRRSARLDRPILAGRACQAVHGSIG